LKRKNKNEYENFLILLVTFAQNETYRTLTDLLELQPKTATAGENRDVVIEKLAKDVLSRVPQPLPLAAVMEKYPVMYEQVYHLHRFNIVIIGIFLVNEYCFNTRNNSVYTKLFFVFFYYFLLFCY